MAGGIFVSYRRDDSRHAAGRLADDLAQHFGADRIFRDIDGIDPGLDFQTVLEQALASCVVMVVVIGPNWLDMKDKQGRRRLDLPDDWIRQEIATALARGIRVVPVLLEGTPLPEAAQMPAELAPLARRQGLELSDTRWRGDLQRLVQTLSKVPGLEPAPAPQPPLPPPPPPPKPWGRIALGLVALVAVVGVVQYAREHLGDGTEANGAGAAVRPPAPGASEPPLTAEALREIITRRIPSQPAEPTPRPDPTVANLSGTWHTLDGETYEIAQDGRQIRLAAFSSGGQPIGGASGEFDGKLLQLTVDMRVSGVPLSKASCHLNLSTDAQKFNGLCKGPNGPFMAQFFR